MTCRHPGKPLGPALHLQEHHQYSCSSCMRKRPGCTSTRQTRERRPEKLCCALRGIMTVKRVSMPGNRGRGIVRRLPGMASSWRVRVAPPWIRQWWERAAPPELMGASPRAVMTSKQTSQILEQIGTEEEVRTTSDSSNYTSSRVPKKKSTKDRPHIQRKRHITQQVTVSRFPPAIRTVDCFPDVCLLAPSFLTNAVYSSYDQGTIKPRRNVTCMAGIHN